MAESVGGVYYDIEARTMGLVEGQKQVKSSTAAIGRDLDNVGKRAATMNTQVSSAAKVVSQSLGGLGRNAGQAGIQLQQLIGQIQGGVNPMIALSQQGADLGFVLGAPLLGAVVGITASLGSMLLPALLNAESASDQLEQSMKTLSGVTVQTENSVSVLTKEISALYKVSKDAALAQIVTGLVAAKNASKEAGQAIRDEFGSADSSFGPFGTSIEDAVTKFDSMNQRIKDFGTISTREIEAQNEFYRDFGETLGATGAQAESLGFGIVSALSGLKSTGDVQSFEVEFSKLVNQFGASNEKLATFGAKLSEFFSQARTAAEAVKFLESAQKDLNSVIVTGSENYADATKTLNEQLQIQKSALTGGAMAANLLAAAFSLGLTSAEQLPEPIRAIIAELNRLENDKIITKLKDQEAQLVMTANEYEIYAAKQSAALSGATSEQVSAIEARIRAMQDLRLGLEAVADQEAEDEQRRQKAITRESNVKSLEQEIYLAGIKNQLGNEEFELKSAILALGKDATPQEIQHITNLVGQMQALRSEAQLLGPSMREAFDSTVLSGIDRLSTGLADAAINGGSAREVLRSLSNTVATELLGSIIRYYIGQAAASVAATTTSTAASTAAAATTTAAWTPAATMASIGTFGGAVGIGLAAMAGVFALSKIMGGGRINGGPVYPGMMHPVTEDGKPELLIQGGRQYLLPGSRGGEVISNKDMQSMNGGGANVTVNVINNSSNSTAQETRRQGPSGSEIIEIVVSDIQSRGRVHGAILNTTTAGNRI